VILGSTLKSNGCFINGDKHNFAISIFFVTVFCKTLRHVSASLVGHSSGLLAKNQRKTIYMYVCVYVCVINTIP
jgi:hypothetical protein